MVCVLHLWMFEHGRRAFLTDPEWMYLFGYSHKISDRWFPWFVKEVSVCILFLNTNNSSLH